MNISTAELKAQLAAARKNGLFQMLEAEARNAALPVAFVLAIASRETNIKKIAGDGGHGRGVMQIDDRSHPITGQLDFKKEPQLFIRYGCNILAANRTWANRRWPAYTNEQRLKISAAAYNCGRGNVLKAIPMGDCDAHTAHGNYGADVIERMKAFEQLLAPAQSS